MKEITIEGIENDIFLLMRKYFERVEIDYLHAQDETRKVLGEFVERYIEVLN